MWEKDRFMREGTKQEFSKTFFKFENTFAM